MMKKIFSIPKSEPFAMFVKIILVGIAYFITARYGLLLAFENTNATPVWLPSGIALSATLILGSRIWPGIFAGAFVANIEAISKIGVSTLASILTSGSTAAGNTLEAVAGAFLINAVLKKRYPFNFAKDALFFILLGPLVSTLISATVGTISFGVMSSDWSHSGTMFMTWWMGDAVGALIVTPMFLTWKFCRSLYSGPSRVFESVLAISLLEASALLVFYCNYPLQHLLFPLLIWIVFRFGLFEAALSVFVMSGTALYCTVKGFGPFVKGSLNESLLFLESYIGISATVTIFLSVIISERKRAENDLLAHRQHLEELVDARTTALLDTNAKLKQEIGERTRTEKELRAVLDELVVAKEHAEESDRIKSSFLAAMSHELRTPLNSIIGFTGILRQGLVGPVNTEQSKQLGMVQNSADHLLYLIKDVLDISKLEAGQIKITAADFDLRTLVNKAANGIRRLADEKGLSLTVDIAPSIGIVRSDQPRVEQILLNLLKNAVKFTEQGSIKLECLQEGGNIYMRVIDTGIGIGQEDIPKLFNAFYQVDNGTTRHYEGTGLGLTLCMKLATLLGGQIQVESELGKGSVFTLIFPV